MSRTSDRAICVPSHRSSAFCVALTALLVLSCSVPALVVPVAVAPTAAPQSTSTRAPTRTPAPTATATPAPGETVRIALLFPMAGDVATFGHSSRQGAVLALEEWNARGGVLGKRIEWVVADSHCDAQEARYQATQVIQQDRVQFIIGEVCSSASIPISEVANAKRVLQISPTSTKPEVTVDAAGKHKPYTFRACYLDPFQAEALAALAYKELDLKTAAVLYDEGNDYVRGQAEYFRDAYERLGGEVKTYESYGKEVTDFSALLTLVQPAEVDALYLPDYYNKASLIGRQAKEMGITAVMIGGDGWDSAQLDLAAVDGGYFANHYSAAEPRPMVQSFIAQYRNTYGAAPDALAVLAYDAANFLLTAIEQAGSADPTVVKDTMLQVQFEGITGRMRMDDFGNPVKASAITQIIDGGLRFFKWVAP